MQNVLVIHMDSPPTSKPGCLTRQAHLFPTKVNNPAPFFVFEKREHAKKWEGCAGSGQKI